MSDINSNNINMKKGIKMSIYSLLILIIGLFIPAILFINSLFLIGIIVSIIEIILIMYFAIKAGLYFRKALLIEENIKTVVPGDSKHKLNFEEWKNKGIITLKYFYDFGDGCESELVDFEQFSKELERFKIAQQEKDLNKTEPIVNISINNGENINGITMISAVYELKRGIFIKKIKTDELFLIIHKTKYDGRKTEYFWSTQNYDEFRSIFYEFVVNQKTPNLNNWNENIF